MTKENQNPNQRTITKINSNELRQCNYGYYHRDGSYESQPEPTFNGRWFLLWTLLFIVGFFAISYGAYFLIDLFEPVMG